MTSSTSEKYKANSTVFKQEDLDKIDWDKLCNEAADFLVQIRSYFQDKLILQKAPASLIATLLKKNKETILENVLVPVQGFLIDNKVCELVVKNPKCLNRRS